MRTGSRWLSILGCRFDRIRGTPCGRLDRQRWGIRFNCTAEASAQVAARVPQGCGAYFGLGRQSAVFRRFYLNAPDRAWGPGEATITLMPDTPADLLKEARRTVPELTPEEAKAQLDRGEIALLIDVREPAEWDAGHIPGALHAPRGMIEWYADPGYPNHKPDLAEAQAKRVVIHCASGGRSLLAAQSLQRLGFSNVISMSGGFKEWSKKGFPVEKG